LSVAEGGGSIKPSGPGAAGFRHGHGEAERGQIEGSKSEKASGISFIVHLDAQIWPQCG